MRANSPNGGVLAASLALALSMSNPLISHANLELPAVVQQYGSSMIADASESELREAQAKFLAERAKLAQTYEASTESTFKSEGETKDKKGVYTAIVGGLVAIAFIAPMVQFFYYTGGD